MACLEALGISKSYVGKTRTDVLGKIDLSIEKGEFVAVVGYSGAGKTTLLSILGGLLQPDSGEIRLNGKRVTAPGPARGVVFQSYALLPWLSAYGNIELAVDQRYSTRSATDKREIVERYLALVNLSAARDKRPAQLSGGMRQRVALARALAMDPEVLLMDEPLGALDALTRGSLQAEIGAIAERTRKTVVLITNDVDEAVLLADRIIPLGLGPAATLGPSFDVELERPRDKKELQHDATFKQLRKEIIQYLLAQSAKSGRRMTPLSGSDEPFSAQSVEALVS
jgi:nitrate/nitrite transport system ATP-binding protein